MHRGQSAGRHGSNPRCDCSRFPLILLDVTDIDSAFLTALLGGLSVDEISGDTICLSRDIDRVWVSACATGRAGVTTGPNLLRLVLLACAPLAAPALPSMACAVVFLDALAGSGAACRPSSPLTAG